MKCRHCGSKMRTTDTRHIYGGYVVQRKVTCPHGHSYTTHEIDDAVWQSIERIAHDRQRRLEENADRFRRNQAIRKARDEGVKLEAIASAYDLDEASVRHVLRHDR